jgi:ribonuclease MRP protein subunit SNM1
MVSPDLTARLRYLNDSAHLLATNAPATSKYLVSQCNSLMFDNNIEQSESHKRNACGACGTIMILGWDSKLEVESRRARRGKGSSRKIVTDPSRAMAYTCESCWRKTRFNISTSPASVPKSKTVSLSHTKHFSGITQASNTSLSGYCTPTHSKPSNTSNITPSRTSNGKKRTRTRKQGGLEAILGRQKATDSRGSSGFDLLDFMKKA